MTPGFPDTASAPGLPLVSIVAPNHNHGAYLGACLDSILFQDYPNLELIIIDDASTDGSHDVIHDVLARFPTETTSYASYYDTARDTIDRTHLFRYPQRGRHITYLRNRVNIGSTASYNRGFRRATGEFCTFVATDDLCHPGFVSTLVDALVSRQADFAYADMFVVDDAGRILREFKLPEYSFRACFQNWYLCGVATLYRRSLHDRFGFYDETAMADDHECYLRFARGGARFVHVPKTLYSVRSHATRRKGLHEPARFQQLLEHSKRLAMRAREEAMPATGRHHG